MEIALYILLGLTVCFILFILLPSIVSFFIAFGRPKTTPFEEMKKPTSYLAPYKDELTAASAFLRTLPTEEVTVFSKDGVRLSGEYIDGGFRRTVIFFHGYRADRRLSFYSQARWFYGQGFNLLFATLRGHGKSGGKWTTLGLKEREDVLAFVRWAEEKKEIGEVLLYGTSMGCTSLAFASDGIASGKKVKAMILDCGFTCPETQLKRDGIKMHVPWRILLPAIRWMARVFLKIDIGKSTTAALAETNVPALFMHGKNDNIVPFEESEKAYAACKAKKELYIAAGAEHTTVFLVCPTETKEKIRALIDAHFAKKAAPEINKQENDNPTEEK